MCVRPGRRDQAGSFLRRRLSMHRPTLPAPSDQHGFASSRDIGESSRHRLDSVAGGRNVSFETPMPNRQPMLHCNINIRCRLCGPSRSDCGASLRTGLFSFQTTAPAVVSEPSGRQPEAPSPPGALFFDDQRMAVVAANPATSNVWLNPRLQMAGYCGPLITKVAKFGATGVPVCRAIS
jgi:hypothetical protein